MIESVASAQVVAGFIQLVWVIPGLPLAAFLINGLFGRRWLGHLTGWIATGAVGLSALLAIGVFVDVLRGVERSTVVLYRWIGVGEFKIDVAAFIDPLSSVMLLVVTVVGTLIFVFANGYMAHDQGFPRFFTWFSLFVFAMLILVMADNYLLMFVGWEGVGLCSYLLIGYWFQNTAPQKAANKAFWMNRIGDWGYTIGMITIFLVFGSLQFTEVFEKVGIATQANLTLICLALFVGATGKSAQLPLYSWLPDAMEGPTPVSALIHAATMVTAGVYLVARSTPLFVAAGPALQVVAVIGALTAIFAATIALVQFDIKRVMAYSTVSQLGYMFLALGVGAPVAAIFHLATHAFFKALLFLGSGSVIHATGNEQDMRKMGGLRRKMPVTYWTMLIAGGALAALPPLAGFWSKDEIVGAAFVSGQTVLWAVGIITAVLTAFYVTRAMWLTFHGEPRDHHLYDHAHESPTVMTLPLILLAVGSATLGILIGFPPDQGFIHSFLRPAVEVEGVEHTAEIGTILALAAVSVAAGLLGIAVGFLMYARHRPDPAAVTRAAGPLYTLLVNKYFVDELYDNRILGLGRAFFGVLWAFDVHVIDGIANGIGRLASIGGGGARRLQTGVVGNYALTVVVGLFVVLVAYGGYAAGIFKR
ncbi:MAG: NADH-quinone oxidoreductase subunit L [Chloroflexi bacterium]|nr:MAG: NADH-quinone oxidoreductase subunit L [Chloroflexota bacterium]TMC28566.1 MAG: NADH-quinone oxidoreductase subunit L [Chloroflexota bacterium]TMC34655.1 MAG: NADH-quinone oxidoreductase subunit L [Chloroflexota bacterium]TMC55883.1 MAG: NADH-quinone oxidoreductase subunit L [Chloroflexota bacterium]